MKNLIYMLLLGWVCCISGCNCGDCEDKCNPECKNYCNDVRNPNCCGYVDCSNVKPTSAFFRSYITGYEGIDGSFIRFSCDTISLNGVSLEADFEGDSTTTYKWKIGSETGFRYGKNFLLRFDRRDSSSLLNTVLRVTLYVQRTPNRVCLPNDDGLDTFYRDLYIVRSERGESGILFGRYLGRTLEQPNITPFEIEIANITNSILRGTSQSCELRGLLNDVTFMPLNDPSWRGVYSKGGPTYIPIILNNRLTSTYATPLKDILDCRVDYYPNINEIRIRYKTRTSPDGTLANSVETPYFTFVGQKL